MSQRTLDEYLKQWQRQATENKPQLQNQQKQEEPRYKIIGFYKETQFQETPIGKIPKEWRTTKLGELFRFRNGKRPLTIKEVGSVPIYGANGIMGYTDTALIEKDYILVIGRVGAAGKVHLARGRVWVSDNAIYSDNYVKDEINPVFAYYMLTFLNLERSVSKTTHPIITQSFIKEISIPHPPLKEQWGIAEVLSGVDRAIEAVDRLIQKLESVKKALMQELLTKGIGHNEYQETPIGKIPKEWKVITIKDIALFLKRGRTPKYGNANMLVIKTVHNYPDRIKFEEAPRAHPDFANKLPKEYLLKPNDILINSTGTGSVGRVGFFTGYGMPCTVDSHITILRVKEDIVLPKYVFYYLASPRGQKMLEERAVGSTNQIELYPNAIETVTIPLPSQEEQQRIVDILTAIDDWIKLKVGRREKLERLKRGLMELLLTGRVRVKVVSLNSGIPSGG